MPRLNLPNERYSAIRARQAVQSSVLPVDLSAIESDIDDLESIATDHETRIDTLEAAPPDYTTTDFNSDFATKTTADLTEGSNLYYTTTRANTAIDARVTKSYVEGLNINVPWASLTSVPSTFTPSTHTHLWADITDKPSTFTPSTHTHVMTDVTDISAAGRNLIDDADASAQRTTLGLGTAAVKNTGTSGNNVALLDGNNTWSAGQIITADSLALYVNGPVNPYALFRNTTNSVDLFLQATGTTTNFGSLTNHDLIFYSNGLARGRLMANGQWELGSIVAQTTANLRLRQNGNNLEWGHTNTSGYHATLGASVGSGDPFVALSAEAGTNNNTFRTRGRYGAVMEVTGSDGRLRILHPQDHTADNQTPLVTAVFTRAGNMGLGTNSPADFGSGWRALTIGESGRNGVLRLSSGTVVGDIFTDTSAMFIRTATNHSLVFRTNDLTRLTIDNTGFAQFSGSVAAVGSITQYSSDERLKTNVQAIEDPITKLKSIGGYTFDWDMELCDALGFIPDGEHEHGVLAQEVQKVVPDAVKEAPFNGHFLAVQYERLVPLLIEVCKDQQNQIEELQEQLNTQESRLAALEALVDSLVSNENT